MITHDAFREIEKELSAPPFFGAPLGATLTGCLKIEFMSSNGDWRLKSRLLYRARMARHWLYPRRNKMARLPPPARRQILVTLLSDTPRLVDLVRPVVQALGEKNCLVLCGNKMVASCAPFGSSITSWDEVLNYNVASWRTEYRRCRPDWAAKIRSLRRKFHLPFGADDVLAFGLMIASQRVAGSIEFLKAVQPRSIVTEYDRNEWSSCLVLAARLLGVPTVTLVHGLMLPDALGFSPVLADKIICWGGLDSARLLAAGEPPEKVLVGGCPRLTRDLPISFADARAKLGLSQDKPVVLFASTNEAHRFEYANLFCEAIEKLEIMSGVVRLHPSENLENYSAVIDRHPGILFFENKASTLDESLAAADVVVVHGSGVGGDALIKHRPVVLLDREGVPHGICSDLATQAGCPHARTPEELAHILIRLIQDAQYRQRLSYTAEIFVDKFCKAFGQDSAILIADIVKRQADQSLTLARE